MFFHRLAARCCSPLVNIYYIFGSLRPPVTNVHYPFAARYRSPLVNLIYRFGSTRSHSSLACYRSPPAYIHHYIIAPLLD